MTTAEDAEDRFLPIKIDTKKQLESYESADLVDIFEVDGTMYRMRKAARADVALAYLEMSDEGDSDRAAYYLLTETLGHEAYDALKGVKGLSDKQFEGVLNRVQTIALPKGKQPRSRRG